MTFPNRSLALALLIAPLAVGCNGKDVCEDAPEDDPECFPCAEANIATATEIECPCTGLDDPRECEDVPYFEPDFALIQGLFAYDAENGQARSYILPDAAGTEAPFFFEVRLINSDDYDPDDDFTYCVVQFSGNALTGPAPWYGEANGQDGRTLSFGFNLPESAQSGSTCGDFDFDPDVWGTGDDPAGDAILAWDWGMAIGEELDGSANPILDSFEEFVIEQTDQATWDDEWAPYVFNGPTHWSALAGQPAPYLGGLIDLNYATGFAVDENFVLQYVDNNDNGTYDPPTGAAGDDELVPVDAELVKAGNAPSGAYSTSSWFALQAECLLGLEFCPQ